MNEKIVSKNDQWSIKMNVSNYGNNPEEQQNYKNMGIGKNSRIKIKGSLKIAAYI